MPQIHLSVPVMEDGVLYNLPNIKRNMLNDGIVEQGTLGGHFTHVHRRNETRRDEVMPDLGDIGQMLGIEEDNMALTVEFPLTLSISQDSNDFGVVGSLVKPIKRLRGDMIQIIIAIERLRTEVDKHTPYSNLLDDVGGEVGVEFSHHTHRSWMRWLTKCPPSLGRNCLAEKISGWWKPFSLMKERFLQMVPNRSAAPSLTNRVTSKFGVGSSMARPYFVGNFYLFPYIGERTQNPRRVMQ